jgi:hypothetical protein
MKKLLFSIVMLALAACAVPESPAQTVYLVQADYAAALKVELAYSNLPRCHAPGSGPICSDVNVIQKLQHADDLAWIAIKQAQGAVRTPGYGDGKVITALASAKALTRAFVDITAKLKTN